MHPTIPHAPYISFSVKYLSWKRLNGLGQLGLRDCVPGTHDNHLPGNVSMIQRAKSDAYQGIIIYFEVWDKKKKNALELTNKIVCTKGGSAAAG